MAEYINRDTFLEQQRAWYCKDCNRRKNTKGKTVYEIGEAPCRACDIGTMLDAVEDYPAADVVERSRWIPVTVKLPEVEGLYLVAVKNDHKRIYSKTAWYSRTSWFARQDVTHWMPLPEPPKEET